MKKEKTIYCTPVTEVLQLPAESVLNPSTWNPDAHNGGSDMKIIEGDPDDDQNGHGAKSHDPYAFVEMSWDDNGLWGDDFESLWN